MWKLPVRNSELRAYRVVRGANKGGAEYRADLQRRTWEKRLEIREEERIKRECGFKPSPSLDANRSFAKQFTQGLESAIAEIESVLDYGLKQPTVSWNDLKDEVPFIPIPPKMPQRPNDPSPPFYPKEPDPSDFVRGLGFLDRVVPGRRSEIQRATQADYDKAFAKWRSACDELDTLHRDMIERNKRRHEHNLERHRQLLASWERDRDRYLERQAEHNAWVDQMAEEYETGLVEAVEFFFEEVLSLSKYPEQFPSGFSVSFDQSPGVAIVDFELPDINALPKEKELKYIQSRREFQIVPTSDSWSRKTYDEVLYQIALRTLHEMFSADSALILKSIVFNGWVQSIDRATGQETRGCILSLQTSREEFLQINLALVEPKACFRKLKGIASSKLVELTPVRPILTIRKDDARFVSGYNVVDSIDTRTNIAAMDWLDFENLIRDLFEKEFSKNGGEVKITQASRDGGVDAIAFDPDPLRGGKIVIQAKRYTNVVGVSAVRDLFGTVHNEGAIKGILVTTSTYGPDAYEFARDKPITLLSGAELLGLLAAHGHQAKIDLKEAKSELLLRQSTMHEERT